jgi:hypothetical protein
VTRPHRTLEGVATLIALLAPPAFAGEWSTIRDENGVTVQEESAPGRVLPVLLGVTTIGASPQNVLSWIHDVSTHTGWMHNCEEARLLRDEGAVVYTYNRLDSPWPVSDRDVILRVETIASADDAVRVEFRSTDEVELPAVSSVVRMPRVEGYYDLRPLDSGGTRVEYRLDSDPGGSLPGWLVKRTSRNLPYFTLINLRSRVEAEGSRAAQ